MLIDWFTIAAQVLNFVILVWLMKRFLYQPILHAIDEREKKIAGELSDAAAKDAAAQVQIDDYTKRNAELDQQKESLLKRAQDDAAAELNRLLEAARKSAIELSTKQKDAMKREKLALHQSIREQMGQEIFALARKAMGDLADANLEEHIVGNFLERLKALTEADKDLWIDALKSSSHPLVVSSTFPISAAQHDALQTAISGLFGENFPVDFRSDSGLIGGIELSTDGQKISWNIADYLSALELAAKKRHDLSSPDKTVKKKKKIKRKLRKAAKAPNGQEVPSVQGALG